MFFYNYSNYVDRDTKQSKLNISFLPKDHLNGVRLEIDGDINMDYLREILFGVDHHLISADNKLVAVKTIKKLFYLNDKNRDKVLDQNEVFELISKNIKSHIDTAIKANHEAFNQLKDPKINLMSWKEYVSKFLLLIGRPIEYVQLYLKKFDDTLLSGTEKEILTNAHRHWMNADIDENDLLSESEYLSFLHPELNSVTLDRLCDKILMHLDRNSDGTLSENEFVDKSNSPEVQIVTPYPGFVLNNEDENISTDNEADRRKYFKEQIDTNHDGVADRKEMLEYINPRNQANVYKDAIKIIKAIDGNSDDKLSLVEMIKNYQKVINSKLVNVGLEFHNSDL